MYIQGITLPEVTLSACTETGQAELSIEVPKQRSYSGRRPVIPCSFADTPCATLGVQGVLNRLNATLGTSRTSRELHTILEDFIERNYDFGSAYALLRPVWNAHNPSNELRRREGKDRERRQKALVGNWIVDLDLAPRRVWDLFSNRVAPSWITDERPTPISHAWVNEKDREDVLTPINGKEWSVPMPKDADLNFIRIEMLNMGGEYRWLDVLCLRQKEEGGPREDLCVEEWRLDVPTIERVYRGDVVAYLNGLGRLLRLKDVDLDSNRSWFRRAWTLQEVGSVGCIIAGDTPDEPMHAQQLDGGNYETALLTRFHEEWHSVKRVREQIFATLTDMQKRVSTNPVDRVAGLAECNGPWDARTLPLCVSWSRTRMQEMETNVGPGHETASDSNWASLVKSNPRIGDKHSAQAGLAQHPIWLRAMAACHFWATNWPAPSFNLRACDLPALGICGNAAIRVGKSPELSTCVAQSKICGTAREVM